MATYVMICVSPLYAQTIATTTRASLVFSMSGEGIAMSNTRFVYKTKPQHELQIERAKTTSM